MSSKNIRPIDWYLKRLPATIEYKWLGRKYKFSGNRGEDKVSLNSPEADKIAWSNNTYTYELNITREPGTNKWIILYALPGWDGDRECILPHADLKEKEIMSENSIWCYTDSDYAKDDFKEALMVVWSWLVEKGLVREY